MKEWDTAQQRVASWQRAIYPPAFDTPTMHFNRSIEEFRELRDAVREDDGTLAARREIGAEAVDVIIRMLGIATVVGANVATQLDHKIGVMEAKYLPLIIQGDLQQGISFDLAMARQKANWTRKAIS